MLRQFFSKKAIGLSIQDKTLKYALITFAKKRVFIDETQTLDPYCKIALQRLQLLLKAFPSAFTLPSFETFIMPNSPEVSSLKDRKKILKNKVESLLSNSPVLITPQDLAPKRKPAFFCLKEKTFSKLKKELDFLSLKPQKVASSTQALFTLHKHFTPEAKDSICVFHFANHVEIFLYNDGTLQTSQHILKDGKSLQEMAAQVLKACYNIFKENSKCDVYLYENPKEPSLRPNLETLNNHLKPGTLDAEFEKHFDHLTEIGGAMSLLSPFKHNFLTPSIAQVLKIFKTDIKIHALIFLAVFMCCFFTWNTITSQLKAKNKNLLEKSFLTLNKNSPSDHELINRESLEKQLNTRQKKSPTKPLESQTYSVTEVLGWLTSVYDKLNKTFPNPFTIEDFNFTFADGRRQKRGSPPVKVSMTFSTINSQTARKVYEEIINSRAIVDQKQKVDWKYQNNHYHVTFFLKSKAD